jgi:hypothetical protein
MRKAGCSRSLRTIAKTNGKPAIDCAPRRQIARQQASRTARPHHIEDAVDDLAHRPGTRSSCALRSRQVGLNHAPFLIGHVGLVSVGLAIMLLAGGWGPHGNSGVGVRTPWNHVDTSHSTPFETASYRANPAGWNFRESQVPLAGWKRSINQDILKS